eukprot:jgi/Chlat1/8489/Chrsp80S07886
MSAAASDKGSCPCPCPRRRRCSTRARRRPRRCRPPSYGMPVLTRAPRLAAVAAAALRATPSPLANPAVCTHRRACGLLHSCRSKSSSSSSMAAGHGHDQPPKDEEVMEHRSDFLRGDGGDKPGGFALLLLNFTLPKNTPELWKRASIRVCADGASNRLYDEIPRWFPGVPADTVRTRFVPEYIKGDLDSLRPDVRDYYSRQYIVVVGSLGGRLDHELSNISTMHRFAHLRVVLLSDTNSARLLVRGRRHIVVPDRGLEGPICGLIPVGAPARHVNTAGLRYNLSDGVLAFGVLVSSSNAIVSDEVLVSADNHLLWTTSLQGDSSSC